MVPWFNLALAERATTSNIIQPDPPKLQPYQVPDKKKASDPVPFEEMLCETEEATF